MLIPHNEINLTHNQRNLLRKACRKDSISTPLPKDANVAFLENVGLLKSNNSDDVFYGKSKVEYFSLTNKGQMYLLHYRSHLMRFWLPFSVSVLALIISGLALACSLWASIR